MRVARSLHSQQDADTLRPPSRDRLSLGILVSALVVGIFFASTTLYLSGLDRAASIALH